MDETALAFELPYARSVAMDKGAPLDRISVRDYVREVEIGAFSSERGRRQRLRFNVVLEVSRHAAAQDDDVDKVISYDTITDAIATQLGTERINLLETLAERVAERCLDDPRAVRVFLRIEKLDRIPGALGVEIVRTRLPEGATKIGAINEPRETTETVLPVVVYLGNEVLSGPALPGWIDRIARAQVPVILVVPPIPGFLSGASGDTARRIALLSSEQNAWALVDRDRRISVAGSRTEIDWALKQRQLTVWAPGRMVCDAVTPPFAGAEQPEALAAWFADLLGAQKLILVAGNAVPETGVGVLSFEPGAEYDFTKLQ